MPHCEPFVDPKSGARGFICGRRRGKREPCFVRDCRRPGEVLCDWLLVPNRPGRGEVTCSRLCCRIHARHLGEDKDYCLEHALRKRREEA
jgi:hypothetical protein